MPFEYSCREASRSVSNNADPNGRLCARQLFGAQATVESENMSPNFKRGPAMAACNRQMTSILRQGQVTSRGLATRRLNESSSCGVMRGACHRARTWRLGAVVRLGSPPSAGSGRARHGWGSGANCGTILMGALFSFRDLAQGYP